MGRFLSEKFDIKGSFSEHLFGDVKVGNCVLCGEFTKLDPHHAITQSRGGGKEDIVYLCRDCHNWVGNNPLEAGKRGLYLKGYKLNKDN